MRVRTLRDSAFAMFACLLFEALSLRELLALGVEVLGLSVAKHALLAQGCASEGGLPYMMMCCGAVLRGDWVSEGRSTG